MIPNDVELKELTLLLRGYTYEDLVTTEQTKCVSSNSFNDYDIARIYLPCMAKN